MYASGSWELVEVCGEGIYGSERTADAPTFTGDLDWYQTRVGERRFAFGHSGTDEVGATTVDVGAQVAWARLLGGGDLAVETDAATSRILVPASPTAAAVGLEYRLV